MNRKRLLLFLLMAFFVPWAAFGQQLTVYDGTVTSNTVPAYIFYFDDFTRSQFVIPAADLTAMDGKTIQSMTFYTTTQNIPYTTVSNADVYLMEVDYTQIDAFEPKASATIVYSGYLDIENKGYDGGEMTIHFNLPYTYHGGNLLVGIENTEDNGYLLINFCGQTVNGASVAGYNAESLDEVVPSQKNFIPKTTFNYADELTVYDGEDTSPYVPAYIFYFDDFTRSQFVIPASKLSGMCNTPVTSMTFYTNATNVPYTTVDSAYVYLREGYFDSSINSFVNFSSSELYYKGYFNIVSTPEGGQMTIHFKTPFIYHGGHLLVGIENTEDNGYKYINFYGQTVSGASVAGSSSSGLSSVQPTQRNFIPKTTFACISNCDPIPLPYSCTFEDNSELECWTTDVPNPIQDGGVGGSNCFHFANYYWHQYLFSPKLEGTSDLANIDVSFQYKIPYQDALGIFQVGYSTTTKSLDDFIWVDEVYATNQEWMSYENFFPQGTKYVAIHCIYEVVDDEITSDIFVDNFNVLPLLCPPEDLCQLTFELYDNYGDGWNGAAIRVVDVETNTVLALLTNQNLNGTSGYDTNELNTLYLNVCDGRALRFEWVPGDWDDECSYTVSGVNGVIFSGEGAMSGPVTHTVDCTLHYLFLYDGDWNDGSRWNTGYVPPTGADVTIQADAIVPTGYVAVANEVTLDGGSITVADRAQLKHNTYGLEVTMEKSIKGYYELNDKMSYHLLMFPFVDATLPQALTSSSGYDLYKFNPNNADAEWRNDRVTDFTGAHFWDGGYLYASPVDMEISVTGTTFDCDANVEFTAYYDANLSNNFNGWNLLGNPYTCNAYVYAVEGENLVPMEVMMYDTWGELVPHANGPIYPMQGFFVHVTQTTTIRVTTTPPEYEYVDLGLPSGMLWATCNVGAASPEDCGDYFAWGETMPKDIYYWRFYQYTNGTSLSDPQLTKYCTDSSYGYNGFTDNLTTLLPEDDAATANWGNGWRMPTKQEWQELLDNTTETYTQQNGVNGRLFTASNGNNIFLPANGGNDDSIPYFVGSHGFYWSSSLNTYVPSLYGPQDAERFHFDSHSYVYVESRFRSIGHSVRPVRPGQNNVPTGAINGKFTINADGGKVYFSQGNLQYQASTNTWKFAENQYDCVGNENSNISPTYSGWIDLFGWGTSGWDSGNTYYHPWDSDYSDGSLYGPPGEYDLTGSYANADWGVYNMISNGGNITHHWRTLTQPEWDYVFNTRSTTSGIRYAKANVNNVNGVILLPDDWSSSTYSLSNTNTSNASFSSNTITATQWATLESAGAVFLPAAGYRLWTSVDIVGSYGSYWSASYYDSYHACRVNFGGNYLYTSNSSIRYYGFSVRLVRVAE